MTSIASQLWHPLPIKFGSASQPSELLPISTCRHRLQSFINIKNNNRYCKEHTSTPLQQPLHQGIYQHPQKNNQTKTGHGRGRRPIEVKGGGESAEPDPHRHQGTASFPTTTPFAEESNAPIGTKKEKGGEHPTIPITGCTAPIPTRRGKKSRLCPPDYRRSGNRSPGTRNQSQIPTRNPAKPAPLSPKSTACAPPATEP